MVLNVITKGILGSFSGAGDDDTPHNRDTFIDTRPRGDGQPWNHLTRSCGNCGEYESITPELAIEFLEYLGYVVTKAIKPVSPK